MKIGLVNRVVAVGVWSFCTKNERRGAVWASATGRTGRVRANTECIAVVMKHGKFFNAAARVGGRVDGSAGRAKHGKSQCPMAGGAGGRERGSAA